MVCNTVFQSRQVTDRPTAPHVWKQTINQQATNRLKQRHQIKIWMLNTFFNWTAWHSKFPDGPRRLTLCYVIKADMLFQKHWQQLTLCNNRPSSVRCWKVMEQTTCYVTVWKAFVQRNANAFRLIIVMLVTKLAANYRASLFHPVHVCGLNIQSFIENSEVGLLMGKQLHQICWIFCRIHSAWATVRLTVASTIGPSVLKAACLVQ